MAIEGLTYADYLRLYGKPSESSEGSSAAPMSEAQWSAMDPRTRYREVAQFGAPEASADQTAAFRAKFGDLKGGLTDDHYQGLGWSYDKPGAWFGDQPSEYMVDPSRVLQSKDADGNTIYLIEKNNVKGDWLARQQARSADSGLWHGDKWDVPKTLAIMAAFAGGGEYLAGATPAEGALPGIASTNAAESGGTLALNPAGTATVPYVPTGAEAAVAAPAVTPGAQPPAPVTESLPPGTQPPAPVTEPLVPGTQPPAPVTEAALPPGTQAPAPVTGTTPTNPGIIDGARNAAGNLGSWFNNLSPGARLVIGSAVSTGASGLVSARAQQQAAAANTEAEARARQDRIRRGQVAPVAPSAFTPRPGIIGSRLPPTGG